MRKTLLLFIALIWLTGCEPFSNIDKQVNPPTASPLPQNPQTLLVFAASSLTESFTELGQSFEKQIGTKVELFLLPPLLILWRNWWKKTG